MGRPKGSRNKPKDGAAGENSHLTQFDSQALHSLVDRIENLEAEKKGLAEDISELYVEAKYKGFDVAALKAVIKFRKAKPVAEARQNAIDAYLHALGHLAGTPLGEAAVDREFGRHTHPAPFA